MKINKWIVWTFVLCVLAYFVAFISGLFQAHDLWYESYAAIIGVLITAIVTFALIKGQSRQDSEKERDSKIFEEKLRIYQDFMKELCEVVKDQKIDEEEEIRLQFQISSIAMHTTEDSILEISKQVKSIIVPIKKQEENRQFMLDQLFAISDIFHKELYQYATTFDENKRLETILNFNFFLIKKEDIGKYEEEQRQEIIKAYENVKELPLPARLEVLKSKIPSNGSKQWIYQNSTLVHDYYTERGVNGNFVKRGDYIGLDLTPINDKFVLNVFSRSWKAEDTIKIMEGIGEGNKINTYEGLYETRHVLKVFNQTDPDDIIVNTITSVLVKLKKYRDENF